MVSTIQNWFLLYQVQVAASDSVGGLVTFGDSITDGTRSKPDTNSRWPDHLVRRMLSQPTPLRMGVMNQGIAGNRVLSEAAYAIGINAGTLRAQRARSAGRHPRHRLGGNQRFPSGAAEPDTDG